MAANNLAPILDDMMPDGVMLAGGDPLELMRNDYGSAGTNMEPSQQNFYSSSQQNLTDMDTANGDLSTIPPTNFGSAASLGGLNNGNGFDLAAASGDGGGEILSDISSGEYAFNLPENATFANPPPIPSAPTNMRILIATDCHLGVRDREPLVADDALRTFEEVLQIAQHKDVDLVLLAGDLFHQNRPSRQTVCRTVEILEKHCLGSRPVAVRFLSNPDEIFANVSDDPMFRRPNWEDPNINIELPIFSIHGNHDDPIGPKNLCELDALHTQRLINYFGKVGDVSNIEIKPVLLEKNGTFLALYGLGSMKDERLFHLLRKGMVKFIRPEPFECNGVRVTAEDMFSVLLFHQNHVAHGGGSANYIPEYMLPEWMDLIVWGHEHDCIPRVVESPYVEEATGRITMRRVLQPGSTVTTSLCKGESLPKHVFMLELVGREWNVEPIKLVTVRPFFIQDVDLARLNITTNTVTVAGADGAPAAKKTAAEDANQREKAVEEALAGLVEKCIVLAQDQHDSKPRTPREPLVRLRVHFGKKDAPLNQKRFGQRFVGRVACPDDILLAMRRKGLVNDVRFGMSPSKIRAAAQQPALTTSTMDDFIRNYFEQQAATAGGTSLVCQNIDLFLESLKLQIDKEDKNCVSDMMKYEAAQMKAAALEKAAGMATLSTPDSVEELTKVLDDCLRMRQETMSVDVEVKKYNEWRSGKPDELKGIQEQAKRMIQLKSLDRAAADLKKANTVTASSQGGRMSSQMAGSQYVAMQPRRGGAGAAGNTYVVVQPRGASAAARGAALAGRGARGGAVTSSPQQQQPQQQRGRPPGMTASAAAARARSASRTTPATNGGGGGNASDDDVIIEDEPEYAPPTAKRGRISQEGFFGGTASQSSSAASTASSSTAAAAPAMGTRRSTRAAAARGARGGGQQGGGAFFTSK